MNSIEFQDKQYEICRDIRKKKTSDYGGINNYRYGLFGAFFDIARKFGRLENIIFNKRAFSINEIDVECEAVEDTIRDIINYSFMLLEIIENEKNSNTCN